MIHCDFLSLEEVVQDATVFDSTHPLVLTGDLNLNASRLGVKDALGRGGFRDAAPTACVPTTPPRHLLEGGRHIDWAFVRGPIRVKTAKVHSSIKASDHYPISFEVDFLPELN